MDKTTVMLILMSLVVAVLVAPIAYYTTYLPCAKYFPEETWQCVFSNKYRIDSK